MDYIKLIDGKPVPYTEAAFRAANRHTVYGKAISNRHLNAQGVYRVRTLPMPEVPVGMKAVKNTTATLNEFNEWVLDWTLVALNEDEARKLRNDLLTATDWWAMSDRTMTDEQAAYRQALRDITAQAGFPDNITWPVNPMENN